MRIHAKLLGCLLGSALLLSSAAANAYWIRPFAAIIGSTVDGLDVDGATSDIQGFSDASQEVISEVDLATASLGGYSRIGDIGIGVTGTANSASSLFGETVTFNSDLLWEPTLGIEGFITTGAGVPGAPSSAFYVLSLTVFEGNTSGGPLDWFDNRGSAIFDDEVMLSFAGQLDLDDTFDDFVAGSIDVTAGQSFDIVARMIVACGNGSGAPAFCEIDASQTATLDMGVDSSLYTSTSGVFLDSGVPEPGLLTLLGFAGLAAAGSRRRKR